MLKAYEYYSMPRDENFVVLDSKSSVSNIFYLNAKPRITKWFSNYDFPRRERMLKTLWLFV